MEYKESKKIKNKIIIIDSGINTNEKLLCKNIIGGIDIKINKNEEVVLSNNYLDDNGHGTYCAKMIISLNEDVGIYVIKILNKEMKCSSKALIEALKYTKDIDINVICLSLATISQVCAKEIKKICSDLRKSGKILIAALSNKSNYSYPSIFKDVIGVKGILCDDLNYFEYNNSQEIQCISNSMPVFLKGINGRYKFFRANSKANALFCGILLKCIPDINTLTLEDIESKLINNEFKLKKKNYYANYLDICASDLYVDSLEITKAVNNIYNSIFGKMDFQDMNENEKTIIFTSRRCLNILEYVESTLDINIQKDLMPQYIFYSTDSLIKYLNIYCKNNYRRV